MLAAENRRQYRVSPPRNLRIVAEPEDLGRQIAAIHPRGTCSRAVHGARGAEPRARRDHAAKRRLFHLDHLEMGCLGAGDEPVHVISSVQRTGHHIELQ